MSWTKKKRRIQSQVIKTVSNKKMEAGRRNELLNQFNRAEIKKELSRKSHLYFMKYCWQKAEPFYVGIHTREICRLIDEAVENFRNNKSTFLLIKVHFRAGKSDIISRFLPPHFLGEFPDKDVMVVSYGQSLSETFSKFSRGLVCSQKYRELYPNYELSGGVQSWGFRGHIGIVTESGLTSSITGKGGHLLICDDYCASRADAESEVIRDSLWEHFTNDFLTRRAPTSIVIVLATPWHVDDIIGRIERRIDEKSEDYDPDFPKFKVISFSAMDGDVEIGKRDKKKYGDNKYHLEKIHYKYLFPERFNEEWYKSQFASLGVYASSGLLQCNPQIRGGNLIDTSKIVFHNDLKDFPQTKYYRIWDLAHSERQRMKDDPDWTSGTLLAYVRKGDQWELWIKDVARIRANALERDNFIRSVSEKDGAGVTIGVEASIDSRDALLTMQTIFNGRKVVKGIQTHGDKVARMSYVEPIFEAGHVHILRSNWNIDWLKEVNDFPSGRHDDQVDNMSAGYELCTQSKDKITVGKVSGI